MTPPTARRHDTILSSLSCMGASECRSGRTREETGIKDTDLERWTVLSVSWGVLSPGLSAFLFPEGVPVGRSP